MRLTLRTMLAYIDGILPPEDAEDIGRRIEESEQATALMHRIRDVMRRIRLPAPGLADRGPGLDPNSVAEYLDNTLHPSRVTDFEKLCLDSDIHLAEVAACHQILALVLGEAAEIDPATRDRMYQLVDAEPSAQDDAPPPPDATTADAVASAGEPPVERRRKPAVPDYLREPRRRARFLPVAVALGLVLCLAVLVLGATGQFKQGSSLRRTLAGLTGSDRAEVPAPAEPGSKPAEPQSQGGPAPSETIPPTDAGPAAPTDGVAPSLPEAGQGAGAGPNGEPGGGQPDTEPDGPWAEPPVEPPMPPDSGEPGSGSSGQPDVGTDVGTDVATPPQPPAGLAGLMSEKEILLRFNPDETLWQRVPRQGIVLAGERLLALPTYRPLLALMAAEVTVQLIDGTQVELLPTDSTGVPGLKADFGRLVLRTVGRPGAQVRVQCGTYAGLVTFVDARSAVALEVVPVRVAATDPETVPNEVAVNVYATTGDVLWSKSGDEEPVRIAAGDGMAIPAQASQGPAALKEPPEWLAGDDATSLENGADRLASANLERELQGERAERLGGGLVLLELNEHPRRENRWLAARCLAYVNQYGPLVATLGDSEFPPVWTDQAIEYLRAGVARSADSAARVREALEKAQGPDAPKLYRMLWGYTEEGLKAGEAMALVDDLENSSLAVRTLAFASLRDFFGLGYLYRPTDRDTVRRARANRWRDAVQSGELWSKRASLNPAQPTELPTEQPTEPPTEQSPPPPPTD